MDHLQEEQTLGKAYDSKLMRRLLRYAKPYWALIGLSILLLLIISVTDLARPYLVKVAIDDHIMGANREYVVIDEGIEHPSVVVIQGRTLIREDRLQDRIGGMRFKLVKEDGQHFLQSTTDQLSLEITQEEAKLLRAWDTDRIVRLGGMLFFLSILGFVRGLLTQLRPSLFVTIYWTENRL